MFESTFILSKVLMAPAILFSLTIHEFMHAWTAWKCGDDTAYRQGRVTLNPMAHLDLVGTICCFLAFIGWAKPVPVNPYNYGNPRRDEILVSGAGVAANFAFAVVLCLLLRFFAWQDIGPQSKVQAYLWVIILGAIMLNFGLFIFNLLPLFPLDGSHILAELLSAPARERFMEFRRISPFLVLGVALFGGQYLAIPLFHLMKFFAGPEALGAALQEIASYDMLNLLRF